MEIKRLNKDECADKTSVKQIAEDIAFFAKRKKNGIERFNSVRFTDNDFNYINCKLIAAGKNKIDIQKLETMNAKEVENLILFLTDFIGYDYKTDDIDEEGKIADTIIEKLLFVLFDRKGETPVKIEFDSTCEKPKC